MAVELFRGTPFIASKYALIGKTKMAIVVDHDLRIIFTERGNYQDVTLLDVSGHAEVYRH